MTDTSTRDQLAEEIVGYHGCCSGDCPHDKQRECFIELIKAGYDARDAEVEALKAEEQKMLARLHRQSAIMASLETERDELKAERDLAIAHDRQPYPTADAYKWACDALHAERERAKGLVEALEKFAKPEWPDVNPEVAQQALSKYKAGDE